MSDQRRTNGKRGTAAHQAAVGGTAAAVVVGKEPRNWNVDLIIQRSFPALTVSLEPRKTRPSEL